MRDSSGLRSRYLRGCSCVIAKDEHKRHDVRRMRSRSPFMTSCPSVSFVLALASCYGVGITACTSLENALSFPPLSTAVTT